MARPANMFEQPAATTERVWLTYLGCVTVVALLTPGAGMEGHDPGMFLLAHSPVCIAVLVSYWLATRVSQDAARPLRAALAVFGLPAVFSALCLLLPAVHPEPYEYVWLHIDRWLLGADAARYSDHMPRWSVEVLQLVYAAFYGLCIAAALLVGRCSGRCAFDRAVFTIVAAFLSSYLGYLLFPTLGPNLVLLHPEELSGLWFAESIHKAIDRMEANPWDCFPSGHALLTWVSLILLWRWARLWFWWLLLPCLALVASTVLLRYHWLSDVVVASLWAWPCVWCCDRLLARDGWPDVAGAPRKE
jgi:membrane-associated phospholipid phosphatase